MSEHWQDFKRGLHGQKPGEAPASPWAEWDELVDKPAPTAAWAARAALSGFIIVAGRYAEVDAVAAVLLVAQFALLLAARRWPRAVVVAVTAIAFVLYARGNGPHVGIGAVYMSLAVLHKERARATAAAGQVPNQAYELFLLGIVLDAALAGVPWLLSWPSEAVLTGPARDHNPGTTFIVLFGLHMMMVAGAELTSAFRSARSGALAAEAARDNAVLEERARIARELHDVVAHQMSVVVTQAQGAEALVDRDPARVREALDTISSTTRDALVELRRLVDVDRPSAAATEPAEPTAPMPGLTSEDIGKLFTTAEAAGLEVEGQLELRAASPVAPGIALAAYRTIQEALTNAAKHAPGSCVRVNVRQSDDALDLEIVNTAGKRAPAVLPSSGVGLIGMRERVTLFGGALLTGASDGGFKVVARFPLTATP